MLVTKDCADAFKAANLPTPAEVIRDRGLIFAHFDLLKSGGDDKKLGMTAQEKNYITRNEKLSSQGVTIFERPGPVYTFFKENAFNNIGDYPTTEVMVHERIHGSSVGKYPYAPIPFLPFLTYGHDLTDYDQYDEILKNCKMQ